MSKSAKQANDDSASADARSKLTVAQAYSANWANAVSGACAGSVAKTITAPLERVKLVLQNQQLAAATHQGCRQTALPLRGLIDALRKLPFEEGGIKSLWRGNGTNVLRVLPTYAARFGLYAHCERALPSSLCNADLRRLCAGALAGGGALLLTHPLDTVRTRLAAARLQIMASPYLGMHDCFCETWRLEGIRGLYAGCAMSLVEVAPYTAIAFAGYEGTKQRLAQVEGSHPSMLSTTSRLFAGVVSGVAAATICYPMDTVRRQLMLDGSRGFQARYQRSLVFCARELWHEGGVPRFYRGCSATLLKSAPSVGITFAVKDFLLQGVSHVQVLQEVHGPTVPRGAVAVAAPA